MNTEHPITPPPELVRQWCLEAEEKHQPTVAYSLVGQIATKAAQWGANQELEACCEWFVRDWTDIETADKLRSARRPKPWSLKEQALLAIDTAVADDRLSADVASVIRRALEALDD